MTPLIIIVALVAINALYVAAEFSSVGVRRSQIQTRAEENDARAVRLLPILDSPRLLDDYIAACQIGITFSSLALGAYAQTKYATPLSEIIARQSGVSASTGFTTATILILSVLTTAQVVLGELLPKSLALRFPITTALMTTRPMLFSLVVLRLFIRFLNGSGMLLLKLGGFEPKLDRNVYSHEEIDMVFAEGRAAGILDRRGYRRLREGLRISERRAHQIMVPRLKIRAIDASLPLEELLHVLVATPYTRLPVYRDTIDNIIGYVHTKKVAARYLDGTLHSIEEVLRPVPFVPETLPVGRLLEVFRREHTHQAIVFDEYGALLGLITLDDVLSELLGEVPDEFKGEDPKPVRLEDGRIRLPGGMARHLAYLWTGSEWAGDAQTVSGHIVYVLGRLPKPGERVTIEGVEVEVEQVANHRIGSVLILPKPTEATQ